MFPPVAFSPSGRRTSDEIDEDAEVDSGFVGGR